MTANVNAKELEAKVKEMYRAVAEDPRGEFHFEMGRVMAERLGYAAADLDRIPAPAIESFAGVGYFFDLATLATGETVLDLGSGSGMDTFVASLKVGSNGTVIGGWVIQQGIAKQGIEGLSLAAMLEQARPLGTLSAASSRFTAR